MFTLTIKTDGAAFGERAYDKLQEVARILKELAQDLEDEGASGYYLRDVNGNKVGECKLASETEGPADPLEAVPITFNYDAETVEHVTAPYLLKWIAAMHSQLSDLGVTTDLDSETHQQLMILAKTAEG